MFREHRLGSNASFTLQEAWPSTIRAKSFFKTALLLAALRTKSGLENVC